MTLKVIDSLGWLARRRWAAPLAAAVALAFLFVAEVGYRRAVEGITMADEILLQRTEVRRLQLLLQAAEAGQRGYLLTGQREYREPFEQAQVQLEAQLARVKILFADDPGTRNPINQIEDLARRKMSELRTTVGLFDGGSATGALEVVKTGFGRDHMRALDKLIDEMVAHEDVKLAYARRNLVDTLFLSRLGIAALVVAGLLLLALAAHQSLSLAATREDQRAQLEHERNRLEHEVEHRTRELTELARHLQSVREDERGRLARELHDELGGLLTAAKLDVARVKSRLRDAPQEILERVGHLSGTLDAGIALKRRIIEDLQPSTLANLGLTTALEVLCSDFARRLDVAIETMFDEVELADDVRLTAYRVVQEGLTNIAKYAKARRVGVRLESSEAMAVLRIHDDGVGFDTARVPQVARGLAGMRFRVVSHGGRFEVSSVPGRGTTIEARLPQHDPAAAALDAPASA